MTKNSFAEEVTFKLFGKYVSSDNYFLESNWFTMQGTNTISGTWRFMWRTSLTIVSQ